MKPVALLLAALLSLLPAGDLRTAIDGARGDHLRLDATLTAVAEVRAREISVKFSHERPGGGNVFGMLDGYAYEVAGEILAWNSYPPELSPAAAVQAWLGSPGHRAVLLGDWNRLGLGVYRVDYKTYYVALFAKVKEARRPPAIVPTPTGPTTTQRPLPAITLPPTDTE